MSSSVRRRASYTSDGAASQRLCWSLCGLLLLVVTVIDASQCSLAWSELFRVSFHYLGGIQITRFDHAHGPMCSAQNTQQHVEMECTRSASTAFLDDGLQLDEATFTFCLLVTHCIM